MTKLIYIVVYTFGKYSDYTEDTIGVFDSKQAAADVAHDYAWMWNHWDDGDGYRYADGDKIRLRRFPLNQIIVGNSEAQRMAEAKADSFGKVLYRLNDDFDNPLLVEVHDAG